MSDRAAFLATIAASPADGAPRQVYADWLDEAGEAEHARIQRLAGRALGERGAESWRTVWRRGFAPILPLGGLGALLAALEDDAFELTQGSTTIPPPVMAVQDWPCEATDAIGYTGWKDDGLGLTTVGEVEEFFAKSCFEADQRLEEAAGCRWFLCWFDDTPRHQMRRELIPEVALAIVLRSSTP